MGLLQDGKWVDAWYDTKSNKGEFKRENAQFRDWISADNAESGRYHLYVSLACPWAHRTLIFRKLKGLEEHITVSIVSTDMLEQGWTFDKRRGSTGDAINHTNYLYEIYLAANPKYSGRVTVPVLWDKKKQTIVNNESADIIRIFNQSFQHLSQNKNDYYPEKLQTRIQKVNAFVYTYINNGVYRAGFATSQKAYEKAFNQLFHALAWVEARLSNNQYLLGDTLTEADWRLFTTLIRFDGV